MRSLYIFLFVIGLLVFNNCATPGMPGSVTLGQSEFDGSRYISMDKGDIYNRYIRLSLFKTGKMSEEDVLLTVHILGLEQFPNDRPSLFFNSSGKIDSLITISESTDFETQSGFSNEFTTIPSSNWSSATYIVSIDYIKYLISSESVKIRVATNEGYHEGDFSKGGWSTAKKGFGEFLTKLEQSGI